MRLLPSNWFWQWYWVPYEPQWLIIPSIVWFYHPGWPRDSLPPEPRANQVSQWSLGLQWGKWFVGFGAYIYP